MKKQHFQTELLKAIAKSTDYAIFALDREGRISFMNGAAELLAGRPAGAAIGDDISAYFPAAIAAQLKDIDVRLLDDRGDEISELTLPTAAGERRFRVVRSPLRDAQGKIAGLAILARDVSESCQTECELAVRKTRLEEAQEGAMVGAWEWDMVRDRLQWSAPCARLYGALPGRVRSAADWRARLFAEDLAAVEATRSAATARREPFEVEFRIRLPSGATRWIASKGAARHDEAGRPLRLSGVDWDITERKQAQAQLEQARNQLRALTARLQAVREEERCRIAAEVHDELGQMLTGLSLELSGLGKRIRKLDNAAMRDELQARLGALDALVRRMLATVRELAGELRPQVLDSLGLPAAIRFEAERFRQRAGIACELTLPEALPQLPAEQATALFRILQEALTNVVRHAHATQVAIALARNDGGGLTLSVRDNGRGITPEEHAAPNALGLLGMHERAAQFAGSVDIAGAPGTGTTVTVTLP